MQDMCGADLSDLDEESPEAGKAIPAKNQGQGMAPDRGKEKP